MSLFQTDSPVSRANFPGTQLPQVDDEFAPSAALDVPTGHLRQMLSVSVSARLWSRYVPAEHLAQGLSSASWESKVRPGWHTLQADRPSASEKVKWSVQATQSDADSSPVTFPIFPDGHLEQALRLKLLPWVPSGHFMQLVIPVGCCVSLVISFALALSLSRSLALSLSPPFPPSPQHPPETFPNLPDGQAIQCRYPERGVYVEALHVVHVGVPPEMLEICLPAAQVCAGELPVIRDETPVLVYEDAVVAGST